MCHLLVPVANSRSCRSSSYIAEIVDRLSALNNKEIIKHNSLTLCSSSNCGLSELVICSENAISDWVGHLRQGNDRHRTRSFRIENHNVELRYFITKGGEGVTYAGVLMRLTDDEIDVVVKFYQDLPTQKTSFENEMRALRRIDQSAPSHKKG